MSLISAGSISLDSTFKQAEVVARMVKILKRRDLDFFSIEKGEGQYGRVQVAISRSQSRQSAKLFLQSSELGLPQPLTRRRVCPPPSVPGVGPHSLAREGWESPSSDEGTYTVVLFIYMYFVISIVCWGEVGEGDRTRVDVVNRLKGKGDCE
jgi:hypothetical protein